MKTLHIQAEKDSPEVYFGPDIDTFQIEGVSLPSDPVLFFEPIFEWLHEFLYSKNFNSQIKINFKLDYFNTATMKQFAKMFRIIDNSPAKKQVSINWYYDEEDIDMLDAGKRFSQFVRINFEFIIN